MPKELSKSKQGAMNVLKGIGVACQTALRLLEQAVVPHHPVPRLTLLHKHQACLRTMFNHAVKSGNWWHSLV